MAESTVNGSHSFVIEGYSLVKGMGTGKHIASENFTVGGYQWSIYFYPDGMRRSDYVSASIALASEGSHVRAYFELTLVDQSGNENHHVIKYQGSMCRCELFYKRHLLERKRSDFLKDDCLKINCTIRVVVCSRLYAIKVPESDIGDHFGMLLENKEYSDVIFNVAGEKFHAHRSVIAARSPVFATTVFGGPSNTSEIFLEDVEPVVFKALLHFIYRDTLPNDVELSVFDTLAAKLMAVADKYDLKRLQLICQSLLCKDICLNSWANISAFADDYHAMELKAVCRKFAANNLIGTL